MKTTKTVYSCDLCGEQLLASDGLPARWITILVPNKECHLCEHCTKVYSGVVKQRIPTDSMVHLQKLMMGQEYYRELSIDKKGTILLLGPNVNEMCCDFLAAAARLGQLQDSLRPWHSGAIPPTPQTEEQRAKTARSAGQTFA